MRPRMRLDFAFLHDALAALAASALAILLVRWLSDPIPGFTGLAVRWLPAAAAGSCLGLYVSSSWRDDRRYTTVRSLARATVTVAVKEAVLACSFLIGVVTLPAPAYYVLAIAADILFTAVFASLMRLSARLAAPVQEPLSVRAARKTAVVAGTGDDAIRMAEDLARQGYDVVGFLTRDARSAGRVIADHVVYLCATGADLAALQRRLGGIDGVFFPRGDTTFTEEGRDIEAEGPQRDGMSVAGHILKRAFDISLSALLLVLFAPLVAVCAAAVRREDGGAAIYAQERIGRGGQPFRIYKFRTMRPDAEAAGRPALYAGEEDPRLTKTGRFLRAHHLDELPQLWNVLRGDMSFMGYRPERQYYIDRIMARNARYRYLYQIRPGVTSYATLYNGYTDTLEKMLTRLDLDLYYLRNHSLWFDAKILGLTFLSIVSGKKF